MGYYEKGKTSIMIDKKFIYILGVLFVVIGLVLSVTLEEIHLLEIIIGFMVLLLTYRFKRNG